jgi:integrase
MDSVEPEHFLFPAFRYQRRKASSESQGSGYDPEGHQKSWRTAWRSLLKETAKRAGDLAYQGAIEAGFSDVSAERERKKHAAAFIGFRFHDLRHCAITKLAESEASDQTIMSIAGHLDRKMLEHYSHIRAQAKRRAVEFISSYNPEAETASGTDTVTVQ